MSGLILAVLKLGRKQVVIEIDGKIDSKSLESLKQDIVSIAKKHGLKVTRIAVRPRAMRRKKK